MNKSLNKLFGLLLGAILSVGFSTVVVADDLCKAKCETSSKSCTKACNGDSDCVLNCSDTRDSCVQRCGD